MENIYAKLFERWERGLNTIDPSEEELTSMWFVYSEGNNVFCYRNKNTGHQLHYVIDVCNFWAYHDNEHDNVYPYSIEDIILLKKAIDEGYQYY